MKGSLSPSGVIDESNPHSLQSAFVQRPPAFPVYPIETLKDLLLEARARYGSRMALCTKYEGSYRPISYQQLAERVDRLSAAYLKLGLKKGDPIALLSENRTEWAVAYLAAVNGGMVVVPVDRDLKEREILHLLKFSGARLLIASRDYLRIVGEKREQLSKLEKVISMDEESHGADLTLQEVCRLVDFHQKVEPEAPQPEDVAALIFTSGTTGNAKAVMLTHRNLAANVVATSHHVAINHADIVLSVLPLHHTYECTAGFLTALYQGATICHAENLRRVADNLKETRASVLLGVPALFEAFYRRIEEGIREKGRQRFRLAQWAAGFSERFLRVNLRRPIFAGLHRRLGGSLRLLISGGAAVNPDVARGFRELGIDFIQGYGMTEHSPIISVNRVDYFKDASVGPPLPGVEVKIEDGEILVKSPCVMKGYYLNEAATAEALRDGWLHTGDLGYLDEDGFLFLSGRKKSVIVTPNGKNIYPEELEAILNQSPFILESLVWGGADDDPAKAEVQAIIVPDTEALDAKFGAASYDETTVNRTIAEEVKKCNRELAGFKKIKRFVLRSEEFDKTTTRKIKRFLYVGKTTSLNEQA